MSLKEKLGSVLKRKKAFDDSSSDNDMSDKKDSKPATPQPASNAQSPGAPTPPKSPDQEAAKIENQIASLQEGLGRIESSITKAVTASSSGFEENIKGLMQKLDDMVMTMQSSQSDKNSPFNSSSLVQELPESTGLAGEEKQPEKGGSDNRKSEHSESNESKAREQSLKDNDSAAAAIFLQNDADQSYQMQEEQIKQILHTASPMRVPMISSRLQEFVKSCALLEIVDSDQKRLNYLYDIGILRTEDLEVASRIVDLVTRYSPNLKPVDLAIIACSIEETAASDRETRKLLAIATALSKSR